jgi:hypothetical protein
MTKKLKTGISGLFFILFYVMASVANGQSDKALSKKYFSDFPSLDISKRVSKYRMTAIYTNRDIFGKFIDKKKISGEYTRGLEDGFALWNNIFIASSSDFSKPFTRGERQKYMENFKYVPSSKMLESGAFGDFPSAPEAVFAKNLVWDMMMIENFVHNYSDSLKINITYTIPEISGEFEMEDIGNYSHTGIQICWTGISLVNGKICAVLEYRALDNKIELKMDQIKTKGTEQYWGTTWVALDDKQIEYAESYSGTIQEIEVTGIQNKFLVKTIREISVEKIQ